MLYCIDTEMILIESKHVPNNKTIKTRHKITCFLYPSRFAFIKLLASIYNIKREEVLKNLFMKNY